MRKRTLIPLLIAVAIVLAFGVMLYLRAKAPPEAARLLPESDAIVFIQLKTVRSALHLDQQADPPTPELKQFTDATGIDPERDIDSAAFALHKVPVLGTRNLHAADLFSSEVFIGRFDGQRLNQYLAKQATSQESYSGRTVYTIPLDGQNIRVAQLAYDTIAVSNMPTAEQIHSMLDRSRASALGTPGSSLLAARFHNVPLLSEAWGIVHIGLPFAQNGNVSVMGLQLPILEDSDLVASLRYTPAEHMLSGGAVQLRVEEIAPDPATAQTTVASLSTLLNLVRSIGTAEATADPGNAALREVLASTRLDQHNNQAILDASATLDQLKVIFKNVGNTSSPSLIPPTDDTTQPRRPCPVQPSGKAGTNC
jgi:hypothetical protein